MMKIRDITFLVASSILYALLFLTERTEFTYLILYFSLLFGCYIYAVRSLNEKALKWAAYIFPLVALIGLPELSDDYFRFVWDGRLIWLRENPFFQTPEYYIKSGLYGETLDEHLFQNLNSPKYYSVYPPVMQLIFSIGAIPGSISTSVLVFKGIMILTYYGIYVSGRQLMRRLGIEEKRIYWLVLNPLFIVEGIGNLHFEILVILFLILSFNFLNKKNVWLSAVFFALAASTKLIPLMFLPAVFFYQDIKKGIKFIGLTIIFFGATFIPFFQPKVILNIWNSIDLYFQTFEFNASIYYIVRYVGYKVEGYNVIKTAGPVLTIFSGIAIFLLTLSRKISLFEKMLYGITIYFLMAGIVHPWYILIPLFLGVVSGKEYPVFWTVVVVISYSAYRFPDYRENLWLITLEYLVLYALIAKNFFLPAVTFTKLDRHTGRS